MKASFYEYKKNFKTSKDAIDDEYTDFTEEECLSILISSRATLLPDMETKHNTTMVVDLSDEEHDRFINKSNDIMENLLEDFNHESS
jgi:hypothetical protein